MAMLLRQFAARLHPTNRLVLQRMSSIGSRTEAESGAGTTSRIRERETALENQVFLVIFHSHLFSISTRKNWKS